MIDMAKKTEIIRGGNKKPPWPGYYNFGSANAGMKEILKKKGYNVRYQLGTLWARKMK